MAYRLLAIDLDGTLLTRHKRILPRTRQALDAAAGLGCRVVIATGRSFTNLKVIAADREGFRCGWIGHGKVAPVPGSVNSGAFEGTLCPVGTSAAVAFWLNCSARM